MRIRFEAEVENDITGEQLAHLLTLALTDVKGFPEDDEGRLCVPDKLYGEYAVVCNEVFGEC